MLSFWRVVSEFTDTQKRQLLKFVTSCSRPPLLGFKVGLVGGPHRPLFFLRYNIVVYQFSYLL